MPVTDSLLEQAFFFMNVYAASSIYIDVHSRWYRLMDLLQFMYTSLLEADVSLKTANVLELASGFIFVMVFFAKRLSIYAINTVL